MVALQLKPVYIDLDLHSCSLNYIVISSIEADDCVCRSWHSSRRSSVTRLYEEFPVTTVESLAKDNFPVTMSAYKIEHVEPPMSRSVCYRRYLLRSIWNTNQVSRFGGEDMKLNATRQVPQTLLVSVHGGIVGSMACQRRHLFISQYSGAKSDC